MTDAARRCSDRRAPTRWRARPARAAPAAPPQGRGGRPGRDALFVVLAIFAPLIAPYDPIATSWTLVRKAPSALHWFGTDDVGRDVLGPRHVRRARLADGGRHLGRHRARDRRAARADGRLSRRLDRRADQPHHRRDAGLPVPDPGHRARGIPRPEPRQRHDRHRRHHHADLRAADARSGDGVKVEDYVEAARAIGNPRWRIALFHILPNILPALLVQATLSIAAAIIAEAALSFLGLGQQPPAPSWGSMLNSAQRFLTNAPWMAIWPGLAIFLAVLSFNLLGDGLRDALDPRER